MTLTLAKKKKILKLTQKEDSKLNIIKIKKMFASKRHCYLKQTKKRTEKNDLGHVSTIYKVF